MIFIEQAVWEGSVLTLKGKAESFNHTFEVCAMLGENESMKYSAQVVEESGQSKDISFLRKNFLWSVSIDFNQVLLQCGSDDCLDLHFWSSDKKQVFGVHRAEGVFWAFVSGFAASDCAIAIPDEAVNGGLVVRCIGREADASGCSYACLKKRPFANRLLLYSLSCGPGITHDFAKALTSRTLKTEVSIGDEGAQCLCSTKSNQTVILDLRGLPELFNNASFRFSNIQWNKSWLSVALESLDIPLSLFENGNCYFEVYSQEKVLDRQELVCLSGDAKCLITAIDVSQCLKQCASIDIVDVSFRISFEFHNERANSKALSRRAKGVFPSFISWFAVSDCAIAIPDEAFDGSLVMRLIGRDADASRRSYARLKKRPFVNRLLLYATSLGARIALNFADALDSENLKTEISVDAKNALCLCTAGEYASVALDIASMDNIQCPTVLDNGKCIKDLEPGSALLKKQNFLFALLLEVDTLCRDNGIEYFLAYGSLLGAIRHKGFIPWDDDVDLFMTEENYNKFVEVYRAGNFPTDRVLEDCRVNNEYPTPFGRYVDCKSTHINPIGTNAWGVGAVGQVVDIFILFPMPEDREIQRDIITRFLVYSELRNGLFRAKGNRDERFVKLYNEEVARCKVEGREARIKCLEKQVFNQRYENPTHYSSGSAGFQRGEILKKEWFDKVSYIDMKGHKFPVPAQYYEVLIETYGFSFKEYPKRRSGVAGGFIESYRIPYNNYVDDYMSLLEKDEVLKVRLAYKDLLMAETLQRRTVSPGIHMLEVWRASFKALRSLEENNIDVLACCDSENFDVLDKAFSEYYKVQLNSKMRYWWVFAPVDDDFLYAALLTLLVWRGDCSSADSLLKLRADQSRPLSPRLIEMQKLLFDITSMRTMLLYGDDDSASEICQEILCKYKKCSDANFATLYLAIQKALHDEDQLIDLYSDAISSFEDTGKEGYIFLAAEICRLRHLPHTGAGLYTWIREHTSDGMMLLSVNDGMEELIGL